MEKSKSRSYYHWIILFCGILLGICNMGNSALTSPIMPFLREQIGMNYSQASILMTLRTLTTVLGTLVMDKVFNKFGLRYGAMIAFASAIAGATLLGLANTYAACLVAFAFVGFGFGLGGMMPAALLMRRWFTKRRGLAVGLCSSGSGIATMVFAAPLASIISESGIFAAQRIWIAVMVVGAVLYFLLVRNSPADKGLLPYGEGEQTEEAKEKKNSGPLKPIAKKDTFLLYSTIVAVGAMAFCSYDNFTLASTQAGYDPVMIGVAVSLFGGIMMCGKPLYGLVADLIGTVRTNYIFFGLAILGHVFFVMMDGKSMFYPYAIVVLMGLCVYTISTVGYPIWTAELASEEKYANLLKKIQTTSTVSGLVLNPFPGIIADNFGSYRPFYVIVGCLLIYALIVIQMLYKRYVPKVSKAAKAPQNA